MRNRVSSRILSNWNTNRARTIYLGGRNYTYNNRHAYVERMRTSRCWVGQDEIEAAAQVYRRNIVIISGRNNALEFPMSRNHPEWPYVFIHANIVSGNRNVDARMSHFQALLPIQ
jgi:hypothetical protein